MGSLALPVGGLVYRDTDAIIYSVERHPVYEPLFLPLWSAVKARTLELALSELTV